MQSLDTASNSNKRYTGEGEEEEKGKEGREVNSLPDPATSVFLLHPGEPQNAQLFVYYMANDFAVTPRKREQRKPGDVSAG